jgi:hypothetical protein
MVERFDVDGLAKALDGVAGLNADGVKLDLGEVYQHVMKKIIDETRGERYRQAMEFKDESGYLQGIKHVVLKRFDGFKSSEDAYSGLRSIAGSFLAHIQKLNRISAEPVTRKPVTKKSVAEIKTETDTNQQVITKVVNKVHRSEEDSDNSMNDGSEKDGSEKDGSEKDGSEKDGSEKDVNKNSNSNRDNDQNNDQNTDQNTDENNDQNNDQNNAQTNDQSETYYYSSDLHQLIENGLKPMFGLGKCESKKESVGHEESKTESKTESKEGFGSKMDEKSKNEKPMNEKPMKEKSMKEKASDTCAVDLRFKGVDLDELTLAEIIEFLFGEEGPGLPATIRAEYDLQALEKNRDTWQWDRKGFYTVANHLLERLYQEDAALKEKAEALNEGRIL